MPPPECIITMHNRNSLRGGNHRSVRAPITKYIQQEHHRLQVRASRPRKASRMKTPQYLILGLFIVGVGLLVGEYYLARWRLILGGLGVNLLAAAVVLLFSTSQQEGWNILPLFIGGFISCAVTLPIFVVRFRQVQKELANERALREADQSARLADTPIGKGSGIFQYARNYAEAGGANSKLRFHEVTQRDFGDYARHFVLSSSPGSTIKVLGIDWTELFGAAVSGTSERYLPLFSDRRTTLQVILLDPRTIIPLEKRLSEFDLMDGGKARYERNFPLRVYRKIIGSVEMLAEYHKKRPDQVKFKFLPDAPAVCCIMTGNQILFHPYSRSHKGWDSPVFVAEKTEGGIYGFLEEYFDFLWNNPRLRATSSEWIKAQGELKNDFAHFRSIIQNACVGLGHEGCEKIIEEKQRVTSVNE